MRDGFDDRGDARPDDRRLDDEVRAAYRAPHALAADAEARVLERVRRERGTGLRWWFTSQPFQLRPALALALGALVLAAGAGLGSRLAARRARPPLVVAAGRVSGAAPAPEDVPGVPVTFVLRAPGASSVSVAGDFNSWDASATPMTHTGTGDLWIVNVELPRGVHLYSFVLDGAEWRPDPSAPLAAGDAFGGRNSVIVVNGAKRL